MQTRREFLKKSAALLGSAAVVGSVPGLLKAQAEDGQEVPAYPYPYVELDPAYVEKLAYEGYFENGCCFGVAKAILVALREKVGYPYTVSRKRCSPTARKATPAARCAARSAARWQ